jgi:hypothetical protein
MCRKDGLVRMPKANVTFPDGTKVTIQGSEAQVSEIINRISPVSKGRRPAQKSSGRTTRPGPSTHIQTLVDEGYFKKKRSIGDIQTALEERGYIYSTPSLSPTLIRLIRKRGPLRRIKEADGYKYVNR